jgi:hypothetical protein
MAAPLHCDKAYKRFLKVNKTNPRFLDKKGRRENPPESFWSKEWPKDYETSMKPCNWHEESVRRIPKTGFRVIEINKPKGKKGKAAWMLKAGQKTAEKGHAKKKKAGKGKKFKLDLRETERKRIDERIEEWFATEEFLKMNNLKTTDFKTEWHKGPSGHFRVPDLRKPRHNVSVKIPDAIKEYQYGACPMQGVLSWKRCEKR